MCIPRTTVDAPQRIAENYYGNGSYAKVIGEANPGVRSGALQIGQKIVVPHPDKVLAKKSTSRVETASRSSTSGHPMASE